MNFMKHNVITVGKFSYQEKAFYCNMGNAASSEASEGTVNAHPHVISDSGATSVHGLSTGEADVLKHHTSTSSSSTTVSINNSISVSGGSGNGKRSHKHQGSKRAGPTTLSAANTTDATSTRTSTSISSITSSTSTTGQIHVAICGYKRSGKSSLLQRLNGDDLCDTTTNTTTINTTSTSSTEEVCRYVDK